MRVWLELRIFVEIGIRPMVHHKRLPVLIPDFGILEPTLEIRRFFRFFFRLCLDFFDKL